MRDADTLCIIRSLAQILCYDLARAEKAKDGKKMCTEKCVVWLLVFGWCVFGFRVSWGLMFLSTSVVRHHTA